MNLFSLESSEPTKIALESLWIDTLNDMYKKCFPSGKNIGQRWLLSPRLASGELTGVGVPPEAEIRYSPAPNWPLGVKRITPSRFHVPPRPDGASDSACTGPPSRSSFFSFPSAKNPRDFPSADQNGKLAHS